MQTKKPLFDDLARVAGGALSALTGLRDEIKALVRHRVEEMLAEMDAVPREEFEAVKAMAAKARSEQEALAKRVAALEARLDVAVEATAGRPRRRRAGESRAPRARATTPNGPKKPPQGKK